MASISAALDRIVGTGARVLHPISTQWNTLEPGPRRLSLLGAVLLAAGFLVAFVWLPAIRTRDAMAVRLPQLEMQLADMQKQAKEIKSLSLVSRSPTEMRKIADVAALQSIFGPDARITVADGGFRIEIAAIAYANWWDKTGDALNRHMLALSAASINRVDGQKIGGGIVSIDMHIRAETLAAGPSPVPQASLAPGK
jgi:type II secretory pathway component PulM